MHFGLGRYRLFEVPALQAANSLESFKQKSGTGINWFAGAHDFFDIRGNGRSTKQRELRESGH